MNVSSLIIKQFQQEILSWYAEHQRELPWRRLPFDTSLQQRDPYKIMVSEIMSQQTQLSRVIPKYEAWLAQFPDVHSLATAATSEVLRFWSGLGYNRRALNLQKAAQMLLSNYSSSERSESRSLKSDSSRQARTIIWPRTVEELKKLPGIGDYTAAAIACFAFNEQVAVVDTNVRKVILTQFYSSSEANAETRSSRSARTIQRYAISDKEIKEIAEQLLPPGKAYEWNQALMDYAAAMLKHEKIPVTKQSKFIGSNRYYRGQIIKLLLQYKKLRLEQLISLLQKDSFFVERLLSTLVTEGMVSKKGEWYVL